MASIQSVGVSADGAYKIGDYITITVTFDGAVTHTALAELELLVGTRYKHLPLDTHNGAVLTFRYRVASDDFDDDGFEVTMLTGAISAVDLSPVDLTINNVADTTGIHIDGVRPAIQSIVRTGSATTNADSVEFTITFNKDVVNVSEDDFQLAAPDGSTATGTIHLAPGGGNTYTVTVDNITGEGALRLDLKSGTDIETEETGYTGALAFISGQIYTIDTTPPSTPTFDDVAGDNVISANEVSGLTISGDADADSTVKLTIGGNTRNVTANGSTWSYAVTADDLTALGAGSKTLKVVSTDAAGNTSSATHNISVDAAAVPAPVVVEPEPEPQPQPPQTIVEALDDIAPQEASKVVDLLVPNLVFTNGSDGVFGTQIAGSISTSLNRVLDGSSTTSQFIQNISEVIVSTTGVARDVYTFFTGSPPTHEGMVYLISSPNNPTDLTDPYYQQFSVENRFINFAVNLGKYGEGSAAFEANYGALSFSEAVFKAYNEVIGFTPADQAGVDIGAALRYIESQQPYFEALGGDAIGAKAAMVGYLLSVGHDQKVGKYHQGMEAFVADQVIGSVTQVKGFLAPAADWDLV